MCVDTEIGVEATFKCGHTAAGGTVVLKCLKCRENNGIICQPVMHIDKMFRHVVGDHNCAACKIRLGEELYYDFGRVFNNGRDTK